MVVDSKARLVTARVHPHMVLIEVSLSASLCLTLTYPGLPAVSLQLPGPGSLLHSAQRSCSSLMP